MLRRKPTTIALVIEEVKDYERRSSYRRYVRSEQQAWDDVFQDGNLGEPSGADKVTEKHEDASPAKSVVAQSSPLPTYRDPIAGPVAHSEAEDRDTGDRSQDLPRNNRMEEPFDTESEMTMTQRPLARPPRRPPRPLSLPSPAGIGLPLRSPLPPPGYSQDGAVRDQSPDDTTAPASGFPTWRHGWEQVRAGRVSEDTPLPNSAPATPNRAFSRALDRTAAIAAPSVGDKNHTTQRKVCVEADKASSIPQPGLSRSASARAARRFMDACIMRRRLASELRISQRGGSWYSSGNEQSAEQRRSPAIADLSAADFRVYDDSVPAISQPQTPQNLPEHRHRSMLLGMYTAPTGTRDLQNIGVLSRRRRAARSPSPSGLQSPGFRGLYGGIENSDDSTLFEQAERRLEEPGFRPGL